MSRRSRKRSFPHWEKKHRKRTAAAAVKAVDAALVSLVPELTAVLDESLQVYKQAIALGGPGRRIVFGRPSDGR